MSTPTPRDVKRILESMADQEPPEGLLERLEADLPEQLDLPSDDLEPRRFLWQARPLAMASLGLVAGLALGFGLLALVGRQAADRVVALVSPPVALSLPTTVSPAPLLPLPTNPGLLPVPTPATLAGEPPPTVPARNGSGASPARDVAVARNGAATPVSTTIPAAGITIVGAAPGRHQRYGELDFMVRDPQGEPLPGVSVTVSSPALQGTRTAVSSAEGTNTLGYLTPGDYRVKVELQGFLTQEADVKVSEARATRLDAVMPEQQLTEALTITGSMETVSVSGTAATTAERSIVQPLSLPSPMPGSGVSGGIPGGVTSIAGAVSSESIYAVNGVVVGADAKANELVVIARQTALGDASEADDEDASAASTVRPRAGLQARNASGQVIGELPLKHTEVAADIAGFMARTVVTQEYANPFEEPIEAVYVFPLGAMAAVNDFVMEVGDRRIVGLVRPREEAERIYRQARERGQTASLLTQERPNIFTQNVANIAPGGSVRISITTFETLAQERGTFEYVFPMVVGPRYIPGAPGATGTRSVGGGGWSRSTTVVPDASRITPPVLKPGERSGHDIGLTVQLDAGLPIAEIASVAHVVKIRERGSSRRTVTLTEADAIANRDFVLRWKVDPDRVSVAALAYRDRGEGYLALLVQPPQEPENALVSAREITFVLDVSGSMGGVPIETSKVLVRRVLDSLRPADAFNIFVFASGNGQLWSEARDSSPENVAVAKRYLDSLDGGGGTEMLAGLRRAITGAHDPSRLQMVVFCTDGFVGDDDRILAFVKQERGEARFFAFGIGSSVNRNLIEGIGRLGAGSSMVVLPREAGSAERAADRFFSLIDAPVLVDAAIDWKGLPVRDAYPEKLGDLFTGTAFNVVARYTRPASGTAYLTGRLGTRAVRIPIPLELPHRDKDHPELAPVWARHRIADLSEELLTADEARATELKTTITDLAVEYRLASQFTAFVAVDESEAHGNGRPRRVDQPVEMPQDVKYEGVFGPAKK